MSAKAKDDPSPASPDSAQGNGDTELKNSVSLLRKAVARIQDLKLPANPQNYSLWYGYYAKGNPELTTELDRLLGANERFTSELSEELFQRFFASGAERQLKQIRTAIRSLVEQLSEQLNTLGQSMDGYDGALSHIALQLDDDPDLATLSELITKALDETRKTLQENQKSKALVSEMGHQLDAMKEALEKLSVEALEDALTGLANRRAFDERLAEVMAESKKADHSSCLLLLDIDRFKLVNDDYGHAVGDRVLCFVAEMIRKCVKGGDFVSRFGGEEFAIILPNTDYYGGLAVGRSISETIANRKLRIRKDGPGLRKITVSGGLSVYSPGDDAETLINRADQCLYKAKSRGRNMVVGEKS